MTQFKCLLVLLLLPPASGASAETGRITRKPPSATEADHIASDMAMNDSLLRKGDIVATDRGFFVFRGTVADGISNDFEPVPNPLPSPPRQK
jgi:hypothetical protein